ncbi:MAG: hypothetical protein CMF31_09820 [Kordiimonas sp.]|nr:hypothetical protein [Kordiimonas sp.]|tara:strand:- start:922 stop:1635 length:714 start_codon:yes stop_codon:yes gene_type:complete
MESGISSDKSSSYESFVDESIIQKLTFTVDNNSGSRRSRSQETRQKILDAAIQCFLESGFGGVSTYDISANVGVTQPVILYHYKSKEGLWKACMDHMFGHFRNALAQKILELREEEPRIFFRELIRHIIVWPTHYPFMIRVLLDTNEDDAERLNWLWDKHIGPTQTAMSHILDHGVKIGILRDLPTLNTHYLLMGQSMIFSLGQKVHTLTKKYQFNEDFIEAQIECFTAMLFVDRDK